MNDKDCDAPQSLTKHIITSIANKVSEVNTKRKLNDLWCVKASSFFLLPEYKKQYYGIKDASNKTIIFRVSDNVACNSILSCDRQKFTIIDRDFNSQFDYDLGIGNVKCYTAYYDIYTEPKPIEHTQISNTIVSNCTVGGDININTQQIMSDLEKLETGIQNTKVSHLHKKDKEKAIILCGQFKDCVINKKKDQSLFDSFVKVLGAIAPALVKLATSIFTSI